MKMKSATGVRYESGPNMTPLVDVVMVILIFLMLAGSFGGAEHYLASAMPTVIDGPGEQQPSNSVRVDEPIEIRVNTVDGHFVARGNTVDAADSAALCRQLGSLRKRMNDAGVKTSDIQVRIAPGRNARYEHVVAVQEAAMQASFEKIGFVSAR